MESELSEEAVSVPAQAVQLVEDSVKRKNKYRKKDEMCR